MKNSCLRAAAILLAAIFAAADVQAAAAQSAPNWSGFYVGANLGGGFGEAKNNIAVSDPFVPLSSTRSTTDRLEAFIAGGQLGYNWQVNPTAILGLEADWQSSAAGGGQSFSDSFSIFVPGGGFDRAMISPTYEARIWWLGTVRGRVGFTHDNLLFYGTGGLAYGRVGISGTVNENVDFSPGGGPVFTSSTPFGVAQTKVGWTLGAGIEGVLAGQWSWKFEYLYVDLGSISGSFAGEPFLGGEIVSVKSRFDENLVRFGVNYRLN
jgi:outer membrane immunogenic protein